MSGSYFFGVLRVLCGRQTSLNFWSRVFQDIKSALDAVRNVNQTVRIDIKVVEHGRLLSFRRRWNEVAHFLRAELVSDVEDAETRILISNKNNVLALECSGPILMDVVGTEPQPPFTEVALRNRASADDHRIFFFADINQPDSLF